ncbi:MAG TPA: AbrB/MazE/SpoVT family DNA-binding domain-containing protein [Candidatus Lokiarchaeia archaeon]|nr:AbrB/MazE/SpoVT family DNA-binding domain-containing protein [Candidatus Lokiarchaeia archaeon]
MTSESLVDEKGRVCIPAELRKRMNLKPGEKVVFQLDEHNTILIRKSITVDEFIEKSKKFSKYLASLTDKPIPTEKIFE